MKNHHELTKNKLIQTFQEYDRIAASMTRKVRSPRKNRYTWEAQKKVDFNQLKQETEKVNTMFGGYINIFMNQKNYRL